MKDTVQTPSLKAEDGLIRHKSGDFTMHTCIHAAEHVTQFANLQLHSYIFFTALGMFTNSIVSLGLRNIHSYSGSLLF